eukprot:CAMPEP_0170736126 /NCGR_PEP_ID=MMETSP0437-20130122/3454_1 /TAXON_ID=0 /ORGANISM="Sexangularia sp." /LENGTH=48 /DNA_ID= /DNA_START= /DNA_END= /DNA_ORIENTATION=
MAARTPGLSAAPVDDTAAFVILAVWLNWYHTTRRSRTRARVLLPLPHA